MNPKEQFIQAWEREFPTTLKVLKAFPNNQGEFKPHERSPSARELAWHFVQGQVAVGQILDGTLELPPKFPPVPEKWADVISTYEKTHGGLVEKLRRTSEADVLNTIKFLLGRGQWGDVPKIDVMWIVHSDQIHHRGQFSVYLRLASGKIPSIYGPTADEPWF